MSNNASAQDGNPSSVRPSRNANVITKLTQNDILFGRGAPIINYEGNVRFRALVSTRRKEYNGTGRHQIKDEIARQIVLEIQRRNGRFLRKVESDDTHQIGVPETETGWTLAEEDMILEKVKQALRDKEPARRQAQSDVPEDSANVSGINQGFQVLPPSVNNDGAGGQLQLLQSSLYPQLSLPPYSNNQNLINAIPAGLVARPRSESDLDILRREQQLIHERNLLLSAASRVDSNAYIQALLRQSQSAYIPSPSTATIRANQSIPSNETLLSMMGVHFDGSGNTVRNQPIIGAHLQNFDEALRNLYRQNRSNAAVALGNSSTPNFASLGVATNTNTTQSMNQSFQALQNYATALSAHNVQQRQELRRQLSNTVEEAYWANSRLSRLFNSSNNNNNNSNAQGLQNSDSILPASLSSRGQLPTGNVDNVVTAPTATARLSSVVSGSSIHHEPGSSERSNKDDRKRSASASGGMESSVVTNKKGKHQK